MIPAIRTNLEIAMESTDQSKANHPREDDSRRWAAIILAAGAGKRMKSKLPKPLHPVAGRAMVLRAMDTLDRTAIDLTVLVVGHKAELVRKTILSETDNPDSLLFAMQLYQLGTGDAARAGLDVVEEEHAITDVVVLNGDMPLIQAETIAKLITAHRESVAEMTFLTAFLDNPRGYGRILRDDAGKIIKIVEEADATAEQKAIGEVNAGVYCFRVEPLREALLELRPENARSEFYLTDAVELFARKEQTVFSVAVTDPNEVMGVNDAAQLAACEKIASRYFR